MEQLIQAFGARRSHSPTAWKLDVLLDLEQLRDPRIVPFLLHVLADRCQPNAVRISVLKRVRNGYLRPDERPRVADVITQLLSDSSSQDPRLQAAFALGEFVEIIGVPAALGSLIKDQAEPLELRYAAFTSLERVGPTPECVSLLRALRDDETLGRLAHSVLEVWHIE